MAQKFSEHPDPCVSEITENRCALHPSRLTSGLQLRLCVAGRQIRAQPPPTTLAHTEEEPRSGWQTHLLLRTSVET